MNIEQIASHIYQKARSWQGLFAVLYVGDAIIGILMISGGFFWLSNIPVAAYASITDPKWLIAITTILTILNLLIAIGNGCLYVGYMQNWDTAGAFTKEFKNIFNFYITLNLISQGLIWFNLLLCYQIRDLGVIFFIGSNLFAIGIRHASITAINFMAGSIELEDALKHKPLNVHPRYYFLYNSVLLMAICAVIGQSHKLTWSLLYQGGYYLLMIALAFVLAAATVSMLYLGWRLLTFVIKKINK